MNNEEMNQTTETETMYRRPPRGYQVTLEELKQQIESDHFKNKEELFKKIVNLRTNGLSEVIDNRKMRELLDLYDKAHPQLDASLDLNDYASASMGDQNLIISKRNDKILQTEEEKDEFENEFKREQNLLSVDNKNELPSAADAFENMSNKKIEMQLVSLEEAISSNSLDAETLSKIKFFITSGYTNPHIIKIDTSKGLFYNIETSDIYEVKYNPNTKQYEIYKNNELDYTQKQLEEQQKQEETLNKPKVRVLKKENSPYLNNAAFTKISFLILNVISIALLITMTVLLNK